MVDIGRAMFLRHRQGTEILKELLEKNVQISLNEIYYLAKKFIVYLTALHNLRVDQLYEVIEEKGGYILHLDTFGDKDSPRIITGLDSVSDFVLDNSKIPTEKSDYIIPFLEEIRRKFGHPLAVVQDMGKGIMNAVESVFDGVMIFICHFHFLRDIGKDLLGDNYDKIRKRLKHHGILTALKQFANPFKEMIENNSGFIDQFCDYIEGNEMNGNQNDFIFDMSLYTSIIWILEGKKLGNGYGFPFDRQHLDFALRINEIFEHIQQMKQENVNPKSQRYKILFSLEDKVKKIIGDDELQVALKKVQDDIKIFDKLRDAMRIAPKEGKEGLNDNGKSEDIRSIEGKVIEFREWFTDNIEFEKNIKHKAFLFQIDKYWDKLFADSIEVKTPEGMIVIQPQRTNNILEQFFRELKQGHMRKAGCGSMCKSIRSMVENTPLIRNLKNETYMKAICGKNKTLEEAFSDIDSDLIRREMEEVKLFPNKIPGRIRKLTSEKDLPKKISHFLKNWIRSYKMF